MRNTVRNTTVRNTVLSLFYFLLELNSSIFPEFVFLVSVLRHPSLLTRFARARASLHEAAG